MPRTFDDFLAAHDPTFRVENPTVKYSRALSETSNFIITAAQNSTPVHPEFWRILLRIAEEKAAEILVIPIRYKNPTSHWSGSQQNAEHWDKEVRPFLWNVRHAISDNLTLLAEIKVQPTASNPLSGADAISLSSSGIIGHPKVQTRSIPTSLGSRAKLLMTSGACTQANYTDSRAGHIGEFHHSLSAILIEGNGIRRLHFDTETRSVTDLNRRYYVNKTVNAPRALALVMGDTHVDYIDPAVEAVTFGAGGIVDTLNPHYLVWHDLLDGYSCNPHHVGNPFNKVAKRSEAKDDVRAEVKRAIEFVRERSKTRKSAIIASNHNDFLRRWIMSTDWRFDPVNAEFYLETALAMCRGTALSSGGTETPDPFRYWFEKAKVPNTKYVDGSFLLGGVELGFHFDRGPNGARGSIKNMSRIGVKTIGGHSHVPGEEEGAVQVGTSTHLRLEYNKGPSSWLNAHCALNADGKRQLIFIFDGVWR